VITGFIVGPRVIFMNVNTSLHVLPVPYGRAHVGLVGIPLTADNLSQAAGAT